MGIYKNLISFDCHIHVFITFCFIISLLRCLHLFFRIAQRRDASVTKEVSMELDSNKKLTRQEKDERFILN